MNTVNYDQLDYWNQRALIETAEKEWLFSYSDIRYILHSILQKYKLKMKSSKYHQMLHIGCGTSKLGIQLEDETNIKVINLDYSENVITRMKAAYPNYEWQLCDILDFTQELEQCCFILDKCCLDTILTRHDPFDHIFQTLFDRFESISDYYIWITYSESREEFLNRVMHRWRILEKHRINPKEDKAAHVFYTIYVLGIPPIDES